MRPNTDCVWWAEVSGGNSSYSYVWVQVGSSNTSTLSEFTTQGASQFQIGVTVTDALGTQRSASRTIAVSSSAPVCPI